MKMLVEWVSEANKKVLIGGAAVLAVLVFGLAFVMMGGEEEPVEGVAESEGSFVPALAPMDQAAIDQSVSATVAALQPTPTVTPPPDVAATLRAEIFSGRMDRLVLNPLDTVEERNPYLNRSELEYLEDLGARLWVYTKVWLHVRDVVFEDPSEWSLEVVERNLEKARMLLNGVAGRRSPSGGEVGKVVVAYGQTIEEGMSEIGHSVTLLGEAFEVLSEVDPDRPLSRDERQELVLIVREVEDSLEAFDRAMSVYGCSVCGELFRQAGGGR